MVTPRSTPLSWFAVPLLWLALTISADAEPQLDTIKDVLVRLHGCWKPPPRSQANPTDITVVVSFSRAGAILGHPRITYESEHASDNDRLAYRIAVTETLQRCAPLSFSDGLGGAVAGRPFAVSFRTRKTQLKTDEKRAWLIQKIL
jgi:hypothetical protein